LWGDHILDVSNYYDPIILNIGEGPKNHYVIPSVGIPDEFPLITIEEDGTAFLAFTEEMSGTVRARDTIFDVKDLPKQKFVRKVGNYYVLALRREDFAKLSIGNINFFILYVKPAPRVLPPPFFDRDRLLLNALIGSALFALLMLLGLSLIPEPKPVTIEMIPERFAKIIIRKRPIIPPQLKAPPAQKPMKEASKKAKAAKAAKPAGKAGKPEIKKAKPKKKPIAKKPKKTVVKKPVKKKPRRKRKIVDSERAKSVGLLKAFSRTDMKKDLKQLLDKEKGVDAFGKSMRAARGRRVEDVAGTTGVGLKGVKVGAGGKSIGIEGPSTKGVGIGGSATGIGEGLYGTGRLGKKGEHSVSVISENIQILSGLPKDVINAVVQRHRAEIRQCYEAARQRSPRLRGKVVVKFNIQPNGIVSYAGVKESTTGDPQLSRCIVSRVRSWRFPKPEAPVVTEVTAYPFYLNPGN